MTGVTGVTPVTGDAPKCITPTAKGKFMDIDEIFAPWITSPEINFMLQVIFHIAEQIL
ncbi:MAG: hypothetical protein G3W70_12115 [Xanthomonas perforans]|nr:hypothetical protein [Xanthomonas perforans]